MIWQLLFVKKTNALKISVLRSHSLKLNLEEITAEVDKLAFESILVNLIENAAKYSPKDTEISIDLWEEKDKIFISVKDQGVGISKEKTGKGFFQILS